MRRRHRQHLRALARQRAGLAPIGTGSHIDAIPNAGSYDGTVGVLGGLEAIRALQRAGFHPRRSIELGIFTAEEPTRFGIGCLGSRMMGHVLTPGAALALRDKQDHGPRRVAHGSWIFRPARIRRRAQRAAFTSLSSCTSSRGRCWSRKGIDLGLVTHIAAPASLRILIEGEGGHAGGKLMPGRKDALAAAAELILALEAAAKSTGAIDTVGTVGVCEVFPARSTAFPRACAGDRHSRHRRPAPRQRAHASRKHAPKSQRRGVVITTELVNADPPTTCDPAILAPMEASRRSGPQLQKNGGPRLSRFVFHGLHRAGRHVVHSLPRRSEPPARRIRVAGVDRRRRGRAGADPGAAGQLNDSL
jgi:ureidoglycolate amidohydrolase